MKPSSLRTRRRCFSTESFLFVGLSIPRTVEKSVEMSASSAEMAEGSGEAMVERLG